MLHGAHLAGLLLCFPVPGEAGVLEALHEPGDLQVGQVRVQEGVLQAPLHLGEIPRMDPGSVEHPGETEAPAGAVLPQLSVTFVQGHGEGDGHVYHVQLAGEVCGLVLHLDEHAVLKFDPFHTPLGIIRGGGQKQELVAASHRRPGWAGRPDTEADEKKSAVTAAAASPSRASSASTMRGTGS